MSRLHILGSGSGITVENRFKSSIVIETSTKNYMFDAGEGCSHLYRNQKLSFNNLCDIFITHIHMDHISGIFQLIEDLNLENRQATLHSNKLNKREIGIHIPQISPQDFLSILKTLNLNINKNGFNLNIDEVDTSFNFSDNNIIVNAHRTLHDVDQGIIAYGYTIKVNKKCIYYSGDLDSIDEIKNHISTSDIAIVELAHYNLIDLAPFVSGYKGLLILTHINKKYGNKKSKSYKELIQFMNSLNIRYVIAEDGLIMDVE